MDNSFINDSISYGISNYMLIKQGKDYDKAHIFEVYVVRCLCKIYGDLNIINPYRINNENSFKSNLIMYGLKVNQMEEFINLMEDYYSPMKIIGEEVSKKVEIDCFSLDRLKKDAEKIPLYITYKNVVFLDSGLYRLYNIKAKRQ